MVILGPKYISGAHLDMIEAKEYIYDTIKWGT